MIKIVSFIAIILFLFGFTICKFAYPNAFLSDGHPLKQIGINNFTDLRYNIYAICLGSMFFVCFKLSVDKWLQCVFFIGMGLSVADLMDRFISGITTFQSADKIIIVFTIIISLYKLKQRGNSKNTSS